MNYDNIAVLIPAYKPDRRLNQLVDDLLAAGFHRLVVVDDGVEHTIQDIAPNYVSGPGVSPAPWPYLILDVASGLFPFPVTSHWARGKGLGGRMLLFICSSPPGSLVPGS